MAATFAAVPVGNLPSYGEPLLVCDFPGVSHGDVPYLAAASLVGCWRRHGHYGGVVDVDWKLLDTGGDAR